MTVARQCPYRSVFFPELLGNWGNVSFVLHAMTSVNCQQHNSELYLVKSDFYRAEHIHILILLLNCYTGT